MITFNLDPLMIYSTGLDCSNSLIDASFQNPSPLTFNSVGSPVAIVNSYDEIFTDALNTDCVLDSCKIM